MSLWNRLFYKTRKFYDDDFDWDNYTGDAYARQLDRMSGELQMIADQGELSFDPATGHVTCGEPPLHPNALAIFEAIGQLQPKSVLETGCGGGDHLGNGMGLFPEITFKGGDRSQGQLDLAVKRHPKLAGHVGLLDLTMPFSRHWPTAEFVYSQAVIMHIHTAVSHFVALSNMINLSTRHVLLMENLQCHNFVEEITALQEGGHTNWDEMNMYVFEGSHGARAILLSKDQLDYPKLTSDAQIREGLKPSQRRLKRADEDTARATYGPARQG